MHLFPAIDLIAGKVVRLRQGDYARQTTYHDDPVTQAQAFEQAGATWLHVVDLEGARSGSPTHLDLIGRICRSTKLNVEVGGGVRHHHTITALLSMGVQRVVLGTAALQRWDWFEQLIGEPDFQHHLVLGLDARAGQLAISGWEHQLETSALDVAKAVSDWPLASIVYTDIAVDGTEKGPNLPATRQMAEATKVPIVASGGVGTLEHLRELRNLPLEGVIVGRALYEGAFTLEQALQAIES